MKTYKKLLEELNAKQKEKVDTWVKKAQEEGFQHPSTISGHVMKENDTIRIPLNEYEGDPHPDVEDHLNSHGYRIPSLNDYKGGYALDKHDRMVSIGKVLNKTSAPDHIKRTFQNDPIRQTNKSNLEVAITYHPHHVAGMSTGRSWTSCMDLEGGSNNHYLQHEIKHGTHVAYLVNKDDHNIENPHARIALKPYSAKISSTEGLKPYKNTEIVSDALKKHNKDFENTDDDKEIFINDIKHHGLIDGKPDNGTYGLYTDNGKLHHLHIKDGQFHSIDRDINKFKTFDEVDQHFKDNVKYVAQDGELVKNNVKTHTILRPNTLYGNASNNFEKTLANWSDTHFPVEKGVTYERHPEVYPEGDRVVHEHSFEKLHDIAKKLAHGYGRVHDHDLKNVKDKTRGFMLDKFHEEIENRRGSVSHEDMNNNLDLAFNYDDTISKENYNKGLAFAFKHGADTYAFKRQHVNLATPEHAKRLFDETNPEDYTNDMVSSRHMKPEHVDKLIMVPSGEFERHRYQEFNPYAIKEHHIDHFIDNHMSVRSNILPDYIKNSPSFNKSHYDKYFDKVLGSLKTSVDSVERAKSVPLDDETRAKTFKHVIGNNFRNSIDYLKNDSTHNKFMRREHMSKLHDFIDVHKENIDLMANPRVGYQDHKELHQLIFSHPNSFNLEDVKKHYTEYNSVTAEHLAGKANSPEMFDHLHNLVDKLPADDYVKKKAKFNIMHSVSPSNADHYVKSKEGMETFAKSGYDTGKTTTSRKLARHVTDEMYIKHKTPVTGWSVLKDENYEIDPSNLIKHHVSKGNIRFAKALHNSAAEDTYYRYSSPKYNQNQALLMD